MEKKTNIPIASYWQAVGRHNSMLYFVSRACLQEMSVSLLYLRHSKMNSTGLSECF